MKIKASKAFIAVSLYRFALILVAVPLQAVIFEGISPETAVYIYRGDLILTLFVLAWIVLRYHSLLYESRNKKLTLGAGVLVPSKSFSAYSKLDCISLSQNLLFRPFRVCRCEVVSARHRDTLYLSRENAESFLEELLPQESASRIYRSGVWGNILMSAGFSNSLTGLLAVIPLLRSAAGVVGEKQAAALLSGIDLGGIMRFAGLPPVLEILASLLLLLWGLGFTAELLQNLHLRAKSSDELLFISRGLITKHLAIVRKSRISCAVLRQSILLSLLKLHTVQIRIPNAKGKENLQMISAQQRQKCIEVLTQSGFLNPMSSETLKIKPRRNALWGYTYLPMTTLSVACLTVILFDPNRTYNLHPYLSAFVVFLCVLWFFFRVFSHRRASLSAQGEVFRVRTFEKLTFTEFYIPKEMVKAIKISESFFQRRKGLCSAKIYIRSRRAHPIRIRHIDKIKTAQLLGV